MFSPPAGPTRWESGFAPAATEVMSCGEAGAYRVHADPAETMRHIDGVGVRGT